MICFNYDSLEQFLQALTRRTMDEVFSQYIEPEEIHGISSKQHKLILQFIGKPNPEDPNFSVLHQCVLKIESKSERDTIMENIKTAFDKAGKINLIKGSINEIFQSIS